MMGGGMWLWSILIIGLIALVVILFQKSGFSFNENKDGPLEIAKKRFAKGEISKDDFEEINKRL